MNLKRCHISFSHTDEHIDRSLEAAGQAIRKLRIPASARVVPVGGG